MRDYLRKGEKGMFDEVIDETMGQEDKMFDQILSGETINEAGDEDPNTDGSMENENGEETVEEDPGKNKEETVIDPEASKKEEPVDYEKQFKDTQAAFTEKSQENADLKKRIKDLEEENVAYQKSLDESTEEEPFEFSDDVKEFFEEYPEAKKAIEQIREHILKNIGRGGSTEALRSEITNLNARVAQANYERAIVSGFVDDNDNFIEGHPDAFRVVRTKEFDDFCKSNKINTENISAMDAIKTISQYKESIAKKSASEHDKGVDERAKKLAQKASGSIESGSTVKQSMTKTPDNEFESTCKELGL